VNDKQRNVMIATLLAVGICVGIYWNEGVSEHRYQKEWLGFAFLAATVGCAGILWFGREEK